MTSSADLDTRLRDAYPALVPDRPSAATRARMQALFDGDERWSSPATRSPLRTRRALSLIVVATVLAVGIAAVLAFAPGDAPTPNAPDAASARAACRTPGPTASRCLDAISGVAGVAALPGRGDVLYRRGSYGARSVTVTASPDPRRANEKQLAAARTPFVVTRRAREELWLAPDGRARSANTDPGAPILATPSDRAAWEAAGRPNLARLAPGGATVRPLVHDFDPRSTRANLLGANGLIDVLPADDPLAGLPRDPAALTAELHQLSWQRRGARQKGCSVGGAGCSTAVLRLIADTEVGDIETLLRYPATPADLRAALIEALGRRPGATSLGLVRTPAGDEVAAVRLADGQTDSDGLSVIAFDPDSGRLSGTAAPQADGTLRWFQTVIDVEARVPRIGARP